MADHRPWLKLWKTAYSDPALARLSPANMGHWVRLLLFVGINGERGRVTLPHGVVDLRSTFRSPSLAVARKVLASMPGVIAEDHGKPSQAITIIFKNWPKYQEDSSAERTRTWREGKKNGDGPSASPVTTSLRHIKPISDGARVDKNREEVDSPLTPQTSDGLIALRDEGQRDAPEAAPTAADEEFADQLRRLRERFGEIAEEKT